MGKEKSKKYDLQYSSGGSRDLKKLKKNKTVLKSIKKTVERLRDDPRPNGVEKLGDTTHRVRDGEYRIVYEIDDAKPEVLVTKIRDRKEVYKH